MALSAMLSPPLDGVLTAKPLVGEARLDDGAGALADRDGHGMFLDVNQQGLRFEIFHDELAGFKAVEAFVAGAGEFTGGVWGGSFGRQGDFARLIEDGDAGQ